MSEQAQVNQSVKLERALLAENQLLRDVLVEVRGGYDDFYASDGPGRLHRLLNAEASVREALALSRTQ